MSTYTTADVRKMVDDLDDIIRASVKNGDIETVFAKQRKAMDQLMRTKRETGHNQELRHEFNQTRYLWEFATKFVKFKKLGNLVAFWKEAQANLEAYEKSTRGPQENAPTTEPISELLPKGPEINVGMASSATQTAAEPTHNKAPPARRADVNPPTMEPIAKTLPKEPAPIVNQVSRAPPPSAISTHNKEPTIPPPARNKETLGQPSGNDLPPLKSSAIDLPPIKKPSVTIPDRPSPIAPVVESPASSLPPVTPSGNQLPPSSSLPTLTPSGHPSVQQPRPRAPTPIAGPSKRTPSASSASSTEVEYESVRIPWRPIPKGFVKKPLPAQRNVNYDSSYSSAKSEYLPTIKVKSERPKTKGKGKMNDETSAPKTKGKGKVTDETSARKRDRKAPQATGNVRDPPCDRCEKRQTTCYSQVVGNACLGCAKMKLRCERSKEKTKKVTGIKGADISDNESAPSDAPPQPRKPHVYEKARKVISDDEESAPRARPRTRPRKEAPLGNKALTPHPKGGEQSKKGSKDVIVLSSDEETSAHLPHLPRYRHRKGKNDEKISGRNEDLEGKVKRLSGITLESLLEEVEWQREVLDIILPGYTRMRDQVDLMREEIVNLREQNQEVNRLYNVVSDQYLELQERFDRYDSPDKDESPGMEEMYMRPEDWYQNGDLALRDDVLDLSSDDPMAETPVADPNMVSVTEPLAEPRVPLPNLGEGNVEESDRAWDLSVPVVRSPNLGEGNVDEIDRAWDLSVPVVRSNLGKKDAIDPEPKVTNEPDVKEAERDEQRVTDEPEHVRTLENDRTLEIDWSDGEVETDKGKMAEVEVGLPIIPDCEPIGDHSGIPPPVPEREAIGDESGMPPPPTPIVTLQPPTPVTSQEAVPSAPTTLLDVPVIPASEQDKVLNTVEKPRSRSTSIVVSDPRRSTRIASRSPTPRRSPRIRSKSPTPTPLIPTKRPSDDSEEGSSSKRLKVG